MKTVFNCLICLAILALSFEVVADFIVDSDQNILKTELTETDDTDDTDESEDKEEGEKEDEWLKEKELFFQDLQLLTIALIPSGKSKMFVQCEHPDEFHLKAPPYSPPELM